MEKTKRNKWIVQAKRDGMSTEQIAYECGITPNRVRFVLRRDDKKHAPYEEKRARAERRRRLTDF